MTHRIKHIIYSFVAVTAILLSGCVKTNECEICPEPDKPVPPDGRLRHTFIAYAIAANNIQGQISNGLDLIVQAVDHTFPEDSRIFIYFDGYPHPTTEESTTKLFEVIPPTEKGKPAEKNLLKQYDEQDASDPEVLKAVLRDIRTFEGEKPAEIYGIMFSSHASGWFPPELARNPSQMPPKGVAMPLQEDIEHDFRKPEGSLTRAFGDDNRSSMAIPDMADALESVILFDYILFDACFMSSVEALYDLRNSADYIVASPTEVMGYGFPYLRIIPALFDNRYDIDTRLINSCKLFVDHYIADATPKYRSASVAMTRTSELGNLANAVQTAYSNGTNVIEETDLMPLEKMSRHAFYDFLNYYYNMCANPADFYSIQKALGDVVVYAKNTPTIYSQYSQSVLVDARGICNISTYYPRTYLPNAYAAYQDTAWYKKIMSIE